VTRVSGLPVGQPVWSPDGKRIEVVVGDDQAALIDLGKPLADRLDKILPPPVNEEGFTANSWSADGKWLAGTLHRTDGSRIPGVVLYSLSARSYRRLTNRGSLPYWLHDSRRLLYLAGDQIFLLNIQARRSRPVVASISSLNFSGFGLSPDDQVLYLAYAAVEGDIWLLSMP
jgi:Tol biopolymer transport system component